MAIKNFGLAAALAPALFMDTGGAHADKLDDVVDAGTLRCGVVLDFPPIGYRDANNQPTKLNSFASSY